jgi:hypothetical protein
MDCETTFKYHPQENKFDFVSIFFNVECFLVQHVAIGIKKGTRTASFITMFIVISIPLSNKVLIFYSFL